MSDSNRNDVTVTSSRSGSSMVDVDVNHHHHHSTKNDATTSSHTNDERWVLQIKMVGAEQSHQPPPPQQMPVPTVNSSSSGGDGTAKPPSQQQQQQQEQSPPVVSDFFITVHPCDDISQLYHEITNTTRVPFHQQRLIYRGRLLPNHHHAQLDHNSTAVVVVEEEDPDVEDESLIPIKDAATTTPPVPITHRLLHQKINEIVGLMNGHSIHLVIRRHVVPTNDENDDEEEEYDLGAAIAVDPTSTTTTTSSAGRSSLLAAILGIGGSNSTDNNGATNNSDQRATSATTTSNNSSGSSGQPPPRATGSSGRPSPTYRLTEDDLIRPDPGSLEMVRQGLLTYHTIQASNNDHHNNNPTTRTTTTTDSTSVQHPGRRFFVGQWIDCRDTVNQWLEATVVRVLYPHDIIHREDDPTSDIVSEDNHHSSVLSSLSFQPTTDPPIPVTDFDGRRRLLLEECTESESEEMMDGIHYRRRRRRHPTEQPTVQILHIHYNGWPVRWDEWIRSDSERIRVFRTRTRHSNTNHTSSSISSATNHDPPIQQQQQSHVSPNIDTIMLDAPYTYITNSEDNDRMAVVPELQRAIEMLQHQLNRVVTSNAEAAVSNPTADTTTPSSRMNHLPWMNGTTTTLATTTNESGHEVVETHPHHHVSQHPQEEEICRRRRRQQELEVLAPLLDRLGRVFIDVAPHVLALADSVGRDQEDDEEEDDDDDDDNLMDENDSEQETIPPATNTLGGLLSLLNRDRRGRGSVASSSSAALPSVDVETSTVASSTVSSVTPAVLTSTTTNVVTSDSIDPDDHDDVEGADGNEGMEYIDPDYRDYATGLVNTTRGDIRSTSGSGSSSSSTRRGVGSDDGTTSLLGAYLAAMSLGGIASISTGDGGEGSGEGLGRLLRDRGSGTGIDIHIHAVVTAPGLDGAIGFAALTGGGGGGTAFPVATPVTAQGTPTNAVNGGFGSLFAGPASNRRGGSRRFRSVASTTNDITADGAAVDGTNIVNDDDMDLFADLYSETPDPINPNNPTARTTPTAAVVDGPVEYNNEYSENPTPSSSPLRRNRSRSRSLRSVPTNHSQGIIPIPDNNPGELYHNPTSRNYRSEQRNASNNEQRNSSNGNNNLLRRIFRRPDGGH